MVKLGDITKDDDVAIEAVIPGDHWFSAEPASDVYSLVSCFVSPGFEFSDFELAN